LNPSLLRLTTPKDRAFDLHLPAGTADKFENAVSSIPTDKRVWWRYRKVQSGETLASIARTYHTTPVAIAEANDLSPSPNNGRIAGRNQGMNYEALSPEARLIIPIAAGKQADTSTYAHATTHYKVRKGDTIESVAENFGVSVKMLRSWNRLKGSSLEGRKVLYLHLPVTSGTRESQVAAKRSPASAHRHAGIATATVKSFADPAADSAAATHETVKHHTVKQGETLYSIASSYNTTVSALKHDNRNLAVLRPGMVLVVRDAH